MLLLGILTLTDSSNWTFKFLHIVLRALNENVTIFAYPNRVVPNGRDGVLAIHNAAYLVALVETSFDIPFQNPYRRFFSAQIMENLFTGIMSASEFPEAK